MPAVLPRFRVPMQRAMLALSLMMPALASAVESLEPASEARPEAFLSQRLAMGSQLGAAAGAGSATSEDGGASAEELQRQLQALRSRRKATEAAAQVAVAAEAAEGETLRGLQDQLDASVAELAKLAAAVNESRHRTHRLEVSLEHPKADLVGPWVDALLHQRDIAAAGGLAGALSVFGPSSYTRPFLALAGSAVGGLMAASSVSIIAKDLQGHAPQDPLMVDAMLRLLGGAGEPRWYYIWAAAVVLGAIRWFVMWDRRPHDVYWPSSRWCSACRRRKGVPTPGEGGPQRDTGAGVGALPAPSAQAPPALPLGSRSTRSGR